jgi:predicted RNA-binding protein with TRAM domain
MASNEDRYGYGHRQDPAHDIGDSAPGTVGDSEGTFHDRAHKDSNVIVDGKVTTQEDHERKSQKSGSKSKKNRTSSSSESASISELSGNEVTVTVDRISGSGNAIANYKGRHVHVQDGEVGEEYRVELKAKASYLIGERVKVNS